MQSPIQSPRQLWRSNTGTIAGVRAGLRLLAYFNLFVIILLWWIFSKVALE